MDAAAVLFAERGYESTSIDDIAERADVSKATFYNYFPSKEELVVQLRRSVLASTVDEAREALSRGDSPLVILEKLLVDRATFTAREPELSKVFYSLRIQHFLFSDQDVVLQTTATGAPARPFRQLIYELVCDAQKLGQIRSDLSPQEVTGMVLALFQVAQTSWISGDKRASLIDKVRRWLRTLMEGVGTAIPTSPAVTAPTPIVGTSARRRKGATLNH
jgi:AcrR family transcriptional regulator